MTTNTDICTDVHGLAPVRECAGRVSVRLANREQEYPRFFAWWRGHGLEAVPLTLLPACGVVVEVDGVSSAVAWVYQDNSCGVAFVGWVLSNPTVSPIARGKALLALPRAVEEVVASQGRHSVCFVTGHATLKDRLIGDGWMEQHTGSEFWKIIGAPPTMATLSVSAYRKDGVL